MSKLSSQAVRSTVLTLLLLGGLPSAVGQIPEPCPERTDQPSDFQSRLPVAPASMADAERQSHSPSTPVHQRQ
jgi:hypothetical protein